MAQQPLLGQGLLNIEDSRPHLDTPLDEWSGRHKDLYLTTHNNQNRHTPSKIRTRNTSNRTAEDARLRRRDKIGWVLQHKQNCSEGIIYELNAYVWSLWVPTAVLLGILDFSMWICDLGRMFPDISKET